MIEKLSFYTRHSLNDLRVNGRRTFFALLAIAAGVAAVVSLQTVAVMMSDTLTGNLQETNRGDIRVALDAGTNDEQQAQLEQGAADGVLAAQAPSSMFGQMGPTQYRITADGLASIQTWIDTHYAGQIEMTYPWVVTDEMGLFTGGTGTSVTSVASGAHAGQVTPVLIDADTYPYYSTIVAADGTLLADLIQSPTDIVIDQKVAETLGVSVGDTLRINGASTDFTLRGIVPTEAEVTDPASDLLTAMYGFYYLDQAAIEYFDGVLPQTDTVYLKLSDPSQVAEVNRAFSSAYPYLTTTTTEMLAQQNEGVADLIHRLVTVVGLVSLLLGSIGIINTMQVIVRRRTVEVAVLKTMGLQAGEVTALFLVEAFIMGVLGSLGGILLGWATTFVIKGVAETVVAQALPFRIALMPAVNGLIVGTLVTTIFGFLPTLAAGQVRPALVLRPNDRVIPRAGKLRTLLALLVILVMLSVVTSLILGSFSVALAVTVGAFVAAGLLVLMLSFVIWVIGRFMPSFGVIDLKLALGQMLAGRGRGAITLLALVVGVFSLSLITLLADSINSTFSSALGSESGGNVVIALLDQRAVADVTNTLDATQGVSDYQVLHRYAGTLVSVVEPDGTVLTVDDLKARINQNSTLDEQLAAMGGDPDMMDAGVIELSMLGELTGRDVSLPPAPPIREGRAFTDADAGKPVIILTDSQAITDAQLKVGSQITYSFGEGAAARQMTFELVGITQRPTVNTLASANVAVPLETMESVAPSNVQVFTNVDTESIPELRRNLSSVPGATVLETALFSGLLAGLLGTFSAFPTMVALLGLIVGGVVIANSVALTTMERRREIAVMKAVGLQRERVLGMLLLENAMLGLVGGLIGVGLGLMILTVLNAALGSAGGATSYGSALLLMLLSVVVALVAAMASAWGASGEQPLNVLRYE